MDLLILLPRKFCTKMIKSMSMILIDLISSLLELLPQKLFILSIWMLSMKKGSEGFFKPKLNKSSPKLKTPNSRENYRPYSLLILNSARKSTPSTNLSIVKKELGKKWQNLSMKKQMENSSKIMKNQHLQKQVNHLKHYQQKLVLSILLKLTILLERDLNLL